MTRRLSMIAAWIDVNLPELRVELGRGYCNTDRKPAGCRHITRTGKGRRGTLLEVFVRATGERILRHNAAEPYRRNADVERWLEEYLAGRKV